MSTLRERARARLRGAVLGLTTPFTPSGDVDEDGLRRNVETYVADGLAAFVVGGTYGEVTTLTQDERRRVIRAAVEQAAGRAAILADTHHVGSLAEVIALTRYAERVGADFAYVMTPYYYRPTDRGLLEFYRAVARAVGIGLVLYTNPWRTHVRLRPAVVRALLEHDNVVAIKAADPDLAELSDLVAAVGEALVVSCGWEVHALHGGLLGAPCYFGIAGNFDPALELEYAGAIQRLDVPAVRRLHARLGPLRRFFGEVDAPVVLKAAQEMVGLCGGPVRLPFVAMSGAERARLAAILRDLGSLPAEGSP